jgi:hypothetical protein
MKDGSQETLVLAHAGQHFQRRQRALQRLPEAPVEGAANQAARDGR